MTSSTENCVIMGNINVNSPWSTTRTMTKALRAYARANQCTVVVPFILGGAMGPVTTAGAIAQSMAEAMVGVALTQLERPGCAGDPGKFPQLHVAALRLAHLRHAGTGAGLAGDRPADAASEPAAALLRRLHHLQDPRWPGDDGKRGLDAGGHSLRRAFHPAFGGLARGRTRHGLREVHPRCRLLRGAAHLSRGIPLDDNPLALDSFREVGPGKHFFGCAHTLRNYETAFWDSGTADNTSFEQWRDAGEKDAMRRANEKWRAMLRTYEAPPLDPAIDEALQAFMTEKKQSRPDMWH